MAWLLPNFSGGRKQFHQQGRGCSFAYPPPPDLFSLPCPMKLCPQRSVELQEQCGSEGGVYIVRRNWIWCTAHAPRTISLYTTWSILCYRKADPQFSPFKSSVAEPNVRLMGSRSEWSTPMWTYNRVILCQYLCVCVCFKINRTEETWAILVKI